MSQHLHLGAWGMFPEWQETVLPVCTAGEMNQGVNPPRV